MSVLSHVLPVDFSFNLGTELPPGNFEFLRKSVQFTLKINGIYIYIYVGILNKLFNSSYL